MLPCSVKSPGAYPQSPSAPELEAVTLARLRWRGDSARLVSARSLNQKGRASAHRLLAPEHRADSFLRKNAREPPVPSCLPRVCLGLVLK